MLVYLYLLLVFAQDQGEGNAGLAAAIANNSENGYKSYCACPSEDCFQ